MTSERVVGSAPLEPPGRLPPPPAGASSGDPRRVEGHPRLEAACRWPRGRYATGPHGPLPGNPCASGMAAWPMDGRCHPPALGEGRDAPTPMSPTGLGPPPQVARTVLHRPRGWGSRAGEPCWGTCVGKAGALRAICASRPACSARVNTPGCRTRGSGELQVSLPWPSGRPPTGAREHQQPRSERPTGLRGQRERERLGSSRVVTTRNPTLPTAAMYLSNGYLVPRRIPPRPSSRGATWARKRPVADLSSLV